MNLPSSQTVVAGLVAGIHASFAPCFRRVDGRDDFRHDGYVLQGKAR